jgi:hypothetical protein
MIYSKNFPWETGGERKKEKNKYKTKKKPIKNKGKERM